MTPDQSRAYNQAIDDAVKAYKNGIGAIKALRLRYVATVEHIGTTTKQDVVNVDTE